MKKFIFLPLVSIVFSVFCCANEIIDPQDVKSSSPAYYIGPARFYKQLQDVAPLLVPGDTVFVDGNTTYPGGINL